MVNAIILSPSPAAIVEDKMNRLRIILLSSIVGFTVSSFAAKNIFNCTALLVKDAWTKLTDKQKVSFMQKHRYEQSISQGELSGVKVLNFGHGDSRDIESRKNICPSCAGYLDRATQFLIENTPKVRGYKFTKPRFGPRLPLVSILVDRNGSPIGTYLYLIREFQLKTSIFVVQNNWVDGYFDESGRFLGKGEGNDPRLSWSEYSLYNERSF